MSNIARNNSIVVDGPAGSAAQSCSYGPVQPGRSIAPHDDDRIIGYNQGRAISRDRFLTNVAVLAGKLPAARHILNLCANRYRFTLGFCAALLRDQLTLLPPNNALDTLTAIARDYPGTIALADTEQPHLPLPCYVHRDVEPGDGAPVADLSVPGARSVAVVFTSGTTGVPQAHVKTWDELTGSTARTFERYALDPRMRYTIVATVVPQHMYGLENSIVLPLQHGFTVHASRPLFPADLEAVTRSTPTPVVLVTTPIHLRAVLNADVELPNVALIVSATAPLAAEVAVRVEKRFGARVLEVYGSTETGVLATRLTASESQWRLLDDLELVRTRTKIKLNAPYFAEPRLLQDRLELLDVEHFHLLGRASDTVKIGGKRASLAGLSAALCTIEGVEDGVFIMSGASDVATRRLVAFAVAPDVDPGYVRRCLRARLDEVFLPRPLVLVVRLPRNSSGKLTRAALERLVHENVTTSTNT